MLARPCLATQPRYKATRYREHKALRWRGKQWTCSCRSRDALERKPCASCDNAAATCSAQRTSSFIGSRQGPLPFLPGLLPAPTRVTKGQPCQAPAACRQSSRAHLRQGSKLATLAKWIRQVQVVRVRPTHQHVVAPEQAPSLPSSHRAGRRIHLHQRLRAAHPRRLRVAATIAQLQAGPVRRIWTCKTRSPR